MTANEVMEKIEKVFPSISDNEVIYIIDDSYCDYDIIIANLGNEALETLDVVGVFTGDMLVVFGVNNAEIFGEIYNNVELVEYYSYLFDTLGEISAIIYRKYDIELPAGSINEDLEIEDLEEIISYQISDYIYNEDRDDVVIKAIKRLGIDTILCAAKIEDVDLVTYCIIEEQYYKEIAIRDFIDGLEEGTKHLLQLQIAMQKLED